ncbi:MAG: tRNA threonylcarbamoyladenosine dehydratase [Oscillospiraceae bacterium]|jgi:tRNA A37 threonylcarbamoyladenosine dehydratase|nr:tRNA threonylcarbamoyladenosine dehydratase [Oscillospiraceae bacterium]
MNWEAEQFLRTEMMLGASAMERLKAAHVAVFGLGGVGGYVVEGLARAGVGALTLVDHDTISLTNLNRQIGATHSTLGMQKTEAMANRVHDINPACRVYTKAEHYDQSNRDIFFGGIQYDYIVDAIDLVSCKLDLIETAISRGIPIISSMGTGNKIDGSAFRVADISKTSGCPLARVIRKELRQRGILHLKVVYSPELPVQPEQKEAPPPGRRSVPASVPWVPACAGLLLSGAVAMELCDGK